MFNSNDDWQETFRKYWYPKLHPYLKPLGGYAIGRVYDSQYVGVLNKNEEQIEKCLDNHAQRNPIAAYKSHPDGRESEGSWVILHNDIPEIIEYGMQLHFTLLKRSDGKPGREIYAHYEDDWRVAPLAHLREKNFNVETGVQKAHTYFNTYSKLELAE